MLFSRLQLAVFGSIAALCLMVAVVQTVRLDGFLWIDGANDKLADARRDLNELRAELKAISDEKDRQRETTNRNIDKARDSDKSAKRVADRIRNAPLSGKCETPKAILEAEL